MRIIDLRDETEFERSCVRLWRIVNPHFSPDVIVGIATGGEYVARAIARLSGLPLCIIKRQRVSTTKIKTHAIVAYMVRSMPDSVSGLLRIIEIRLRELLFLISGRALKAENVVPVSIDSALLKKHDVKVLLLDDAIDSGSTLDDAVRYLKSLNREVNIYSAALAQTYRSPVFLADQVLYKNCIVRGPWALDSTKR